MTKSSREIAAELTKQTRQQKKFLCDLLKVLDALDRAQEHWQKAELDCQKAVNETKCAAQSKDVSYTWQEKIWQGLRKIFNKNSIEEKVTAETNQASSEEIVRSAKEGIEIIRLELLDVLKKQSVTPIETIEQQFTPDYMYAIGRKENQEAEENTVLEEVVRGYLWREKTLREAQVIVSTKPSEQSEQKS